MPGNKALTGINMNFSGFAKSLGCFQASKGDCGWHDKMAPPPGAC